MSEYMNISLSGPQEGPEAGLAQLLIDAINGEWETVNMYNGLLIMAKSEGFDEFISVLEDINTEENKHIGQLQELLKKVSPNAEAIDSGAAEAHEQFDDDDSWYVDDSPVSQEAYIEESWEDILTKFKKYEKDLNGDGEAITALVDQECRDNKGDPDYEIARKKWMYGDDI